MAGPDVVVVEDDEDLRAVLAKTIENAGFSVSALGGAPEAMAKMRAQKPRIVLLDLLLADSDAGGLLEQMRADRRTRDIPVVLISGTVDLEKHARRLGAVASLQKPFSTRELLGILRSCCGGTPPPRHAR